jgi:DNA repair exonuclease SbcCD ATPase subunit
MLDLLMKLLQPNPNLRMDWPQFERHPIMLGFDKDAPELATLKVDEQTKAQVEALKTQNEALKKKADELEEQKQTMEAKIELLNVKLKRSDETFNCYITQLQEHIKQVSSEKSRADQSLIDISQSKDQEVARLEREVAKLRMHEETNTKTQEMLFACQQELEKQRILEDEKQRLEEQVKKALDENKSLVAALNQKQLSSSTVSQLERQIEKLKVDLATKEEDVKSNIKLIDFLKKSFSEESGTNRKELETVKAQMATDKAKYMSDIASLKFKLEDTEFKLKLKDTTITEMQKQGKTENAYTSDPFLSYVKVKFEQYCVQQAIGISKKQSSSNSPSQLLDSAKGVMRDIDSMLYEFASSVRDDVEDLPSKFSVVPYQKYCTDHAKNSIDQMVNFLCLYENALSLNLSHFYGATQQEVKDTLTRLKEYQERLRKSFL